MDPRGPVGRGPLREPRQFGATTGSDWAKSLVDAPIGINFSVEDSLPNIVASPEFRVLSASRDVLEGQPLVKVEYDLGWQATESIMIRLVGRGTLWLDDKHFWVMRKCDFKMQWGVKGDIRDHSAALDYDFGGDGSPSLRHLVIRDLDAKGEEKTRSECTYALKSDYPPEREFTMTAFGLPEPVGMSGRNRSNGGYGYLLRRPVFLLSLVFLPLPGSDY